MKTKKIKGFTLIELIIVMALTAIMLVAIMTMSKPVNDLVSTAANYDTRRTVSNEINNYVCQSTKYATYATIYTGCKKLPDTAIADFMASSGATTDTYAIPTNIRVIAIMNDFTGVSTWPANNLVPNTYKTITPNDYGRIFKSESIDSSSKITYYTAMGKWYYGNSKYQFDFKCNKDPVTNDYDGTISIETTTYDKNGNPGLKANLTSKFLNFDIAKFTVAPVDSSNTGVNTYIIYTKS